jgi:hypothetical protein
LGIAPDVVGGNSWTAITSGANASGTPPGNDGNSYVNSPHFSFNCQAWGLDFSEGILLADTPEPSTIGFFLAAGLFLLPLRFRH